MTISDPPYGDGWRVAVAPDGTMTTRGAGTTNDAGVASHSSAGSGAGGSRHGFLFYEADAPAAGPARVGWLVSGATLHVDLAHILTDLGLQGAEVEALVTLDITPPPDAVRRVLFVVRPLVDPVALVPPSFAPFERTGFSVIEWGVLRDLE